MRPYFEKMQEFGKPLTPAFLKQTETNVESIKEVEDSIEELKEKVRKAGLPQDVLNKRGEWTVHQRLEYLVDKGTWCPLHMLFDPMDEDSGTTGVVD